MRALTPRHVIREMDKALIKPWWLGKFRSELIERLTSARFNGHPLIDTPMSQPAIEAVFEEAVEAIMAPTDLVAEIERDLRNASRV